MVSAAHDLTRLARYGYLPVDFQKFIESTTLSPSQITQYTSRILALTLAQSKNLDAPNFTVISPNDLGLLYNAYDQCFFDGQLRATLGKTPLSFSLSKRMTSAGGTTTCRTVRQTGQKSFEIRIATSILFGCFQDDHRPISASGIVCRDRLDALQRVMEHELSHLVEMLIWNESSCAQARFHSITQRFFGHTDNKHQLITPREKAYVNFGIRPGLKVRFRFDGQQFNGIVNRINKRATVLVEDARGTRYSNGKHYLKYYIPARDLEIVE